VNLDRELSALHHEEHQTAFAFEGDLVAGREAALVELVRETLEVPLVEVGEQADVTRSAGVGFDMGDSYTTGLPRVTSSVLPGRAPRS
jgi:hypothetical protein